MKKREILKFCIDSTDGGQENMENTQEPSTNRLENVLKPDRTVWCTKEGNNFHIVLSPLKSGGVFTISDITMISPSQLFTAPCKNALIWILDKKLTLLKKVRDEPILDIFPFLDQYDNFTRDAWETLDKSVLNAPDARI
jgi:hypothetical protein